MKFKTLLEQYREGRVDEADLVGVSAEDWMAVRTEAGNGALHYAMTTDAYAAPDALEVGDMVSWNNSGGRAQGKIDRIERDGSINVPDANVTVGGTEDDPAALITLYRGGEPTDTKVAHKFSTLTKISQTEASYALGMGDEDKKKKKGMGGRAYAYTMVSDELIPPFNDRVLANSWDFSQFNYRGGNILYDHNIAESRPPIGKGTNLKRGQEITRGKRSFKAVTGDVTFADREIYPFAGMIEDLVEADILTNGSVGFDVMEMRPPSKKEVEELGMKPFSAVITKASLVEFSITPLGRDQNAQKLALNMDPLEAKLLEFSRAGIHDDALIGEFRESLLARLGNAERTTITVPEIPGAEPAEADAGQPADASEIDAMRQELSDVRADVAALRVELADQKDRTEFWAELFAVADAAPEPEPEHKTTTSNGLEDSDSPLDDYYSLAVTLGYAPEN